MDQYSKKGYLNSEFRLFHLTDQETQEVDYHYHDFDKITIFIKGSVTYMSLDPTTLSWCATAISTASLSITRKSMSELSSISLLIS